MMQIQGILMLNKKAAECLSVFHVSSGEATAQRLWVEYDVEINVQTNHINWLERGLNESAVARLNKKATAADFEGLSSERTTLSSERCSVSLEVRMELSQ